MGSVAFNSCFDTKWKKSYTGLKLMRQVIFDDSIKRFFLKPAAKHSLGFERGDKRKYVNITDTLLLNIF